MGVPERITRRFTSREFNAWNVSESMCVEAWVSKGRTWDEMFIYQSFSIGVLHRKGEGQSCNSLNVLLGFSMSRTRRSLLRVESVSDPRWHRAVSPGWVTFLPLAATQRATLSSSSAFPPLPSTARADTVSLPSHLANRQSETYFTTIQ